MEEKKPSKLSEIKGIASDATEIMRQIGNPEMLESLNKVKDTAKTVNEIIQGLNTSEMVKNIENFRLISENMNEVSTNMNNTMNQLRETGIIYDVSEIMKFAKSKINSFDNGGQDSTTGQDLHDLSTASKEMMLSVKDLINEITVTVASSKKSITIQNVKDTVKAASDVYKTTVA